MGSTAFPRNAGRKEANGRSVTSDVLYAITARSIDAIGTPDRRSIVESQQGSFDSRSAPGARLNSDAHDSLWTSVALAVKGLAFPRKLRLPRVLPSPLESN